MDSTSPLPSSIPYLVIPCCNEVQGLEKFVTKIIDTGVSINILLIDATSSDKTAREAQRLAKLGFPIEVIDRPTKTGFESACREGFKIALRRGATAIIEMDADLSHNPDTIAQMLDQLDKGVSLAIGSTNVARGCAQSLSRTHLVISQIGTWYARKMLSLEIRDSKPRYRAFDANVLRTLDLTTLLADGFGTQIDMAQLIAGTGHLVSEIPIVYEPKSSDASKAPHALISHALNFFTLTGIRGRLREWRLGRPMIQSHMAMPERIHDWIDTRTAVASRN